MYAIFDVGGTTTRVACSKTGKTFEEVKKLPTNSTAGGFENFIAQLKQELHGRGIKAVAGGLPGHANHSDGLRYTHNMPGWSGVAVKDRLEAALGVPVYLDNDTAVVGLGEAVHGAGRGYSQMVYMTVSTGINGARIVNGAIDVSVTGWELGSMLLPNEAGQLVQLESLTGGSALARRYGQPPRELRDPAIWHQEARHLARALHNTILHWSPQVVVYGGSMMRDIPLESIRRELAELPRVFEHQPELKLAELGDEGGLHGALALLAAQRRR
jgi:glucokinase